MATQSGALLVDGLTHSYGGELAIQDVSFDIAPGEIVALLGPSGCGKSTVLRAIAGLIQPAQGQIMLAGKHLGGVAARERGIGMVFQNYALFPHLTVEENVAYPLACQHVPKAARKERVRELLALIQLDGFGRRLPRELSGGQQQRVAVARALAASPALLLLDEPFGALDRALRFDLQVEMLRLQKSVGITTLIVTHDQEEAQSLASRLVLMNKGHVEQIDTPSTVYDRPKTLFVNSFIGQANQLRATVVETKAESAVLKLDASGSSLTLARRLDYAVGVRIVLTCRPEQVSVHAAATATSLPARLIVSVPLGPTLVHDLELADGTQVRASQMRSGAAFVPSLGDQVHVTIDADHCHVFPVHSISPSELNKGAKL
ncbi:MAG: transporter nucleotide binding/ATPase protein [Devosia sp.]|uniref:ABC transporter ATP-binding protein n=1 Tax=Devosia sp. TaxID=1871048 RepID=UPI00262E3F2D|nr:ABC transporter ATP-binding protein [Devosia sp.]MDB5586459.1 transporter nucleotide binding/ATPase protein [Devosia sp.]